MLPSPAPSCDSDIAQESLIQSHRTPALHSSVIGTLAGGVASVAGIGGGGEASNLDSALDLLQ